MKCITQPHTNDLPAAEGFYSTQGRLGAATESLQLINLNLYLEPDLLLIWFRFRSA